MKKLWIGLILICMILFGCADRLKEMETSYSIRVTGSEQMTFIGHYTFAEAMNLHKTVRADGVVPAEYQGRGMAAACVFRKTAGDGKLKVEILKAGKVISAAETEQPFGLISLGKLPDTDSIINKILGMMLG